MASLASHDAFQNMTIIYTLNKINHITIEYYQIYQVFISVILIVNIQKLTKINYFRLDQRKKKRIEKNSCHNAIRRTLTRYLGVTLNKLA